MTAGIVSDLTAQAFSERLSDDRLGIRLGPFNALIGSDVRQIYDPLFRLYDSYPLLPQDSVFSFHVRLRACRPTRHPWRRMVSFTVDGRRAYSDLPIGQALPALEWGINLVIAFRFYCFLMLHAAVLERHGRAVLLPAAPGHGKSTLCAGLANRGYRLLSDEFGLIRPDTTDFLPIPRPVALKNESIDVMRAFAPDAFIGPPTENTRKGTVAHVRPSADSIARQSEPAAASLVVFPRWLPDTELNVQPMTAVEGFMRLGTNAFNYDVLGEAAFRTVRDVIQQSRCYSLVYSDLDEAIDKINELARDDAD